ncbi:MAG: ADP-ribosylation factor-like protein [Candidatus Thorarchaeota archaeon]
MSQASKIYGIWILDEISRITIVKRTYREGDLDDRLVQTLYSTILSFSNNTIDEKVGTIMMEDRLIVYEKVKNLYFIVVAEKEYENLDAKRVLSHLRVTFLRRYPIRDYNWQSDEIKSHYQDFSKTIDEIVKHFGITRQIVKIVLTGLDYAGKTTLAHSLVNSKYQNYLPTKGLDIIKLEYKNLFLRIWDLGGQRQFRTLWRKFSAEASGVIFVLDSTSDRWTETKEAFETAKSLGLPYMILANKQDEVDTAKDITYIAEQLGCPFNLIIPGSALLNQGVFELLDQLLENIQVLDLKEGLVEKRTEKMVQIN